MTPWTLIPIFLVNRNRCQSLRQMILWLLGIGCRDIRILDNDSSYPPLIEYYAQLPAQVTLLKLGANLGPQALWKSEFHRQLSTPYIVSDADLVPAGFCPADLIQRLLSIITRFPDCGKVAPGLRVDTIHPHYGQAEAAFRWESQFWSRPIARGLFAAPVDTTFALYPAGAAYSMGRNNIRLGYPYLLEHTPWQVDERHVDEEECFYRKHTEQRFSHWSAAEPDSRIEASEAVKHYETRKTILHLGCGNEYIPGWVNVDVTGRKLDIEFDLDACRTQKLPIADNSVDGFYLCHVFEHVKDVLSLMQELYRVAKNGAIAHLRLPYGSSNDAWEDPTHARAYFESSFLYFSQPAYSRADYGYTGDWQCERVSFLVDPAVGCLGSEMAMDKIKSQRNVVREMIVELTAVKPARARLLSLLRGGAHYLISDERVVPTFGI